MKRIATALVLAAAAAVFAIPTTVKDIYQPNRHLKDQGIKLVPWGSGTIAEADETSYDGAFSLRVSTHNYFQGGYISFEQPVDLSSAFADKNNLLFFTFRPVDVATVMGPAQPQGGRGEGSGVGGRGGRGGGPADPMFDPLLQRGGERGGGGFGGGNQGGAPGQGGPQPAPPRNMKMVRVIIGTSDGKKSEAYLELPTSRGKEVWKSVAIPLQAIPGFDKTNKTISQIGFSADTTSTYYVGNVRIVNDPAPIKGEMNAKRDLNLALGDQVTFVGYGDAGATILKYTWDFDDSDGIQEDAVGQAIQHKFRRPGKFVVTLTIKDYYGIKEPFSTKVNITVNP